MEALRENAMAGVNQNHSLLYFLEFLSDLKFKKQGKVRRRGAGPKATALRNAWHVVPRSVGFLS